MNSAVGLKRSMIVPGLTAEPMSRVTSLRGQASVAVVADAEDPGLLMQRRCLELVATANGEAS